MTERRHEMVAPRSGGRLDHVLTASLRDLSRSRIQKLIRQGYASVNGTVVTKNGYSLSGGEHISVRVPVDQPTELLPEDIPLDVLFENKDVLVINKPAGIVVHPSAGHEQGTLVHAVLAHVTDLRGIGGERRPGVVHRLDMDTSGVLIFAKNDAALSFIQAQFKDRSIEKHYLALVDGAPPTPSGRIEAPIGRDPRERKRMAIVTANRGRAAVTLYHTQERYGAHTLLDVQILTGRTHQIRVHLAFLGCPVAGDSVYGRRKATISLDRQFLHAAALTLKLPGEDATRTFQAPLPADLQAVLTRLTGRG